MTYVVDRIEGEVAVLQDEKEKLHIIPLKDLPSPLHRGDVIHGQKGAYTVDAEQTKKRRSQIQQLQERLRGR